MEELKYGLLGDQLVHIDDVEKGLACNCVCPHCKTQLVAKKGNHRAKHFAHYKLADCNHGTETALHLMAKSIVAKTRKVFVPYVPKTEYDLEKRGKVVAFEKAELEKQLSSSVRGDILLYTGESCLNVEIKVTHKVDLAKTIELFNLGISAIEVDLSDLQSSFTPEIIEQRLVDSEYVRLISSPKCKEIFARWILGEWKDTHVTSYGVYVNDCPLSRAKAYFIDHSRRGGSCECHECAAFRRLSGQFDEKLLCYGCLDNIDFSNVEKILHLEKEENHICVVRLLMNDGSVIERSPKKR